MKSDESVQVDWRSYIAHVPIEEYDLYENERPSYDDLAISRYHRPDSVGCHIPLCPLHRASQFPTYTSIVYNLTRPRAEFGFRRHIAKGVNGKGFETVGDFGKQCNKINTLKIGDKSDK